MTECTSNKTKAKYLICVYLNVKKTIQNSKKLWIITPLFYYMLLVFFFFNLEDFTLKIIQISVIIWKLYKVKVYIWYCIIVFNIMCKKHILVGKQLEVNFKVSGPFCLNSLFIPAIFWFSHHFSVSLNFSSATGCGAFHSYLYYWESSSFPTLVESFTSLFAQRWKQKR